MDATSHALLLMHRQRYRPDLAEQRDQLERWRVVVFKRKAFHLHDEAEQCD